MSEDSTCGKCKKKYNAYHVFIRKNVVAYEYEKMIEEKYGRLCPACRKEILREAHRK